jgi:hypothetical protein
VYFWATHRESLRSDDDAPAVLGEPFEEMQPRDIAPLADASQTADQLVAEAADRLLNGPQLHATARFQVELLDQRMAAPGHYWQEGNGTGRSRLEFTHVSDTSRLSVLQVSDGRYFYWYRKLNGDARLEYVDLRQVQQLGASEAEFLAGGKAWDTVGGLPSMLQHLAKAFRFEPPQSANLDGIPVILVRGRWKQKALIRLLEGQVDAERLSGSDWWRCVPEHIPHAVELTLGADDRFPLFPYRIVFSRYREQNNQVEPVHVVVLELFEVERPANIPDRIFQVAAVTCEPVDITAFYVDRVEQFTRR